jgi:hypothetical protein
VLHDQFTTADFAGKWRSSLRHVCWTIGYVPEHTEHQIRAQAG